VRPDAYLIVAAGQRLYAPTPEELAKIAECAFEAADEIEGLRAHAAGMAGNEARGGRALPRSRHRPD
jgi:hypothetical protein